MFDPNSQTEFGNDLQYSHRSQKFHELMIELEELFQEKFNLQDWKIVFVTGSGTLVNEVVLRGFKHNFMIHQSGGKFANRLLSLDKGVRDVTNFDILEYFAYVFYETSNSSLVMHDFTQNKPNIIFADMISAFPYYEVPEDVDVFTCVSGKQLGAHSGIGIIAFKKKLYSELAEPFESYLSLGHHVNYSDVRHETPYTPALSLFADLHKEMTKWFDVEILRSVIDNRRKMLESKFPPDSVVGTGPVFSIKKNFHENIEHMAKKFSLYETPDLYQIFLWSGTDQEYDKLWRFLHHE